MEPVNGHSRSPKSANHTAHDQQGVTAITHPPPVLVMAEKGWKTEHLNWAVAVVTPRQNHSILATGWRSILCTRPMVIQVMVNKPSIIDHHVLFRGKKGDKQEGEWCDVTYKRLIYQMYF